MNFLQIEDIARRIDRRDGPYSVTQIASRVVEILRQNRVRMTEKRRAWVLKAASETALAADDDRASSSVSHGPRNS